MRVRGYHGRDWKIYCNFINIHDYPGFCQFVRNFIIGFAKCNLIGLSNILFVSTNCDFTQWI